jgi:hypothetical protein
MAAVLILEPIFEADLQDEQYAYRAKRDAHDCAGSASAVEAWVERGSGRRLKRLLGSMFILHPFCGMSVK